ncbi:MAG: hypothetical protein F6K30_18210 [Cyanothece sp. SIO2G6]|nr:hypothetical protein [Cyanothece sp. SIO2G6]
MGSVDHGSQFMTLSRKLQNELALGSEVGNVFDPVEGGDMDRHELLEDPAQRWLLRGLAELVRQGWLSLGQRLTQLSFAHVVVLTSRARV